MSTEQSTVQQSVRQERLPDWWQREKQRRQNHLLILLLLIISLIAFFYHISHQGVAGTTGSLDFDTANTIAFVRQEANGQTALYDVRADGTGLRRLTAEDDISDKSAPAWNNQGSQIYYASNRADRQKMQIYTLGKGDIIQLTYGTGRKENPLPTPDGKRVAFLTLGAVKTVFPNGNDPEQILPPPRVEGATTGLEGGGGPPEYTGPFLSAAFSTDGAGIAGVKELGNENTFTDPNLRGLVGGDQVAEVVPPNGTKSLPLDAGNAVSVAWEPNGSRLMVAFAESPRVISDKGEFASVSGLTLYSFEKPEIPTSKPLLVNVGLGSEPRNLVWSPDGKKLAFETWMLKSEKERQLLGVLVMNVPDKLTRFAPDAMAAFGALLLPPPPEGTPHTPVWSPDGSRLLYQVTRADGKNDLWVINSDLTNPLNLTKGQGNNTQAVWSPKK